MRVAVAADHAGYLLKQPLMDWLKSLGHEVVDSGGVNDPLDDYPDFAESIGQAIRSGQADRGVLFCGSGVGAAIAANKIPGIRAGLCHDTYSARQGVEHDAMNVLVLGGRVIGIETARECTGAFIGAQFSGEERHVRRLAKVQAIEDHYSAES
jgi:ribose 5-phosphate isomerase B